MYVKCTFQCLLSTDYLDTGNHRRLPTSQRIRLGSFVAMPELAMAMAMATMATCATSSSSFLGTATTALSSYASNSSSWEAKCFLPFGVVSHQKSRSEALVIRANNGGDMLGDFGGRNPYPAELESNFGDKVIGFAGTEHNILIPTLSALSLAEKTLKPVPEGTAPLTEDQAKALLRKIVGWRLSRTEAGLKLQCDWNLKDEASVSELYSRISAVADAESYLPEMQTLEGNKVRVEVWTSSIGGLTENDFIFAAKVDQIHTKDLSRKNRTWF